ncbi:MAG: prepilin peptidase [Lachnospiraceae bacterium]|nr:prepilin peptidase [Lachnospiraceae bacterium]
MLVTVLFYLTVFIYGIIIGSFLNVCIYRLPLQENIVTTRSHCMKCGYQLRWYDLVPLFSYLLLGGRCRKCKEKISVQYPLIEALNGFLYVIVVAACGVSIEALLYCLLVSALIVLSVIDFRTYEIPVGINYFIAVLGVARVATDYTNWLQYLIGMICVSGFLLLVYWITKGRGIGGGDIKLMAASGLLLGWQLNILAFVLGCILGSVIHLIRMRFSEEGNVLALGPYLAVGIAISALWGTDLIGWYLSLYAL